MGSGKHSLLVEITARDNNVTDSLKKINAELKHLEKMYKITNDTLKKSDDSFKQLQNSQAYYANKIKLTSEKEKILTDTIKKTEKALDKEKQSYNDIKNSIKHYSKELSNTEKSIKQYSNKISELKTKNKELNDGLLKSKDRVSIMREAYAEATQKIEEHRNKIKELKNNEAQNIEIIKKEEKALSDLSNKRDILGDKLTAASIEYSNLSKKVNDKIKENNEKIKEYSNIIENNKSKIKENTEQKQEWIKKLQKSKSEINGLEKKIETYGRDLELAKAKRENLTKAESEAHKIYQKDILKKEIQRLKEYSEQLEKTAEKYRLQGEVFNGIGNGLLAATAPFIGLGTYGVKSAIEFESAFAGVRKTVNASEPEFEKLKSAIVKMSEKMPQSASEISKVMEVAGQLNVPYEDLESFTETMIKLGDSTNISSEQAGLLIAQFANITKLPTKDVDKLASVIVDLGNNTATTEDKIVDMMHSLGAGGSIFGLNQAQITGLAATLSSLGLESEKAGTASTKFMLRLIGTASKSSEEFKKIGEQMGMTAEEIEETMGTAGKDLENFSKVAGVTSEEFKKMVRENPADALVKVVSGLGEMGSSSEELIPILEALGIKEVRLRDTVLRLAQGHGSLAKNMKMAEDAWNKNTALNEEAGKRYETTESKLKMLKNQFQNMAIEIGVELLPSLLDLMSTAKDFVKWIKNLDDGTKATIITFVKLGAATGVVFKGMGIVSNGISRLYEISKRFNDLKISDKTDQLNKVGKGLSNLTQNGSKATGAIGGLSSKLSLLSPMTVGVVAGVGAVALTIAAVNTHTSLMNKNILHSKEKMSAWEQVIANLTGVQKKSNEELEKMGAIYSDTSKLSDGFKDAVERSRTVMADFNYELEQTNLDGVFNLEESDKLDKKLNDITKSAINVLEESKKEIQDKLKETFSRDGIFSEEEAKTIEFLTKEKDTQITEVNKLNQEIKDIKSKAIKENNRKLTEEEIEAIKEKARKIKEIELQNLTKSHEDRLYMKNKFKNEIGNLDLTALSEKIQAQKKAHDEEIANITSLYDTQIQLLEEQLPKLSEKEKEEAEKHLETLKENKEKALETEKEHFDELLKMVKEKYPELADEINENTGKILTENEKKWSKDLENFTNHYEGLNNISKTGWYKVQNTTTGAHELLYTKIDETTGKIVGCYSQTNHKVYGETEEIKKSLEKVKENAQDTSFAWTGAFQEIALGTRENATLSKAELENLQDYLGFTKDEAGNLSGTITDLNGNPIDIVINNKGEIVSGLDKIKNAVNNIPSWKEISISANVYGSAANLVLGNASGTNYLRSYASGINSIPSFSNGGYVRTRVNEMGWELFDIPKNRAGIMIGTNRGDDIMDLPVGTKITNHIASTRMMIEQVKREVAKQMTPIYRDVQKLNVPESKNGTVRQDITVKFENVVIRDETDIRKLINLMRDELKKEGV